MLANIFAFTIDALTLWEMEKHFSSPAWAANFKNAYQVIRILVSSYIVKTALLNQKASFLKKLKLK